mgnify:CR=1 FL=1
MHGNEMHRVNALGRLEENAVAVLAHMRAIAVRTTRSGNGTRSAMPVELVRRNPARSPCHESLSPSVALNTAGSLTT